MSDPVPQTLSRLTIYLGVRRFLLLAPSIAVDRAHSPYRRLSASILLACAEPFQIEAGDVKLSTRAVLVAPKVPRQRLSAIGSDLAIIDLPMHSPECCALDALMSAHPVLALDFERFAPLLPALRRGFAGSLTATELTAFFNDVVVAITGQPPAASALDPRVEKAMQLLKDLPLGEANLPALAARLHLSPSRLRHLFKAETGNTVSHYARWIAVWRAISLWSQGRSLTDIAHEVGFFDLAHLDHAFMEVFGLNPSTVIDPRNISLIRYD
ncbi:MAG: helix-turn-helix domain-containing protein [Stenotrophobium sp.]